MARLVYLIETDDTRGLGTKGDPVRGVRQWYTVDGELVVEAYDKWGREESRRYLSARGDQSEADAELARKVLGVEGRTLLEILDAVKARQVPSGGR